MKVIFLDFDGPIIPIQSHHNRRALMEKAWPPCIDALNRITDETGAKIVVSSSWRTGGITEMRTLLKSWGVTGSVIAVTPDLSVNTEVLWKGAHRGDEIQRWMTDRIQEPKPQVESFVILDDDDDMGHLIRFLIQTPFEFGLTEEDADRAIQMLTAQD